MRILVAGVGNRLMGDDGFGPRVIDLLRDENLPNNVEARDIGTANTSITIIDTSPYKEKRIERLNDTLLKNWSHKLH